MSCDVIIIVIINGCTALLLDLCHYFGFLILYTVCWTPWARDQSDARPLPTHRTTRTEWTHTETPMTTGIRIYNPSIRTGEDSLCLRLCVHCERRCYWHTLNNTSTTFQMTFRLNLSPDKGINLCCFSFVQYSVLLRICRHWPPLWSSGQSSWLQIRRPWFDSRHYQKKKVVDLERGPLSLVSTTEELLDRKVAAPV
jgi:hypothetical protein